MPATPDGKNGWDFAEFMFRHSLTTRIIITVVVLVAITLAVKAMGRYNHMDVGPVSLDVNSKYPAIAPDTPKPKTNDAPTQTIIQNNAPGATGTQNINPTIINKTYKVAPVGPNYNFVPLKKIIHDQILNNLIALKKEFAIVPSFVFSNASAGEAVDTLFMELNDLLLKAGYSSSIGPGGGITGGRELFLIRVSYDDTTFKKKWLQVIYPLIHGKMDSLEQPSSQRIIAFQIGNRPTFSIDGVATK